MRAGDISRTRFGMSRSGVLVVVGPVFGCAWEGVTQRAKLMCTKGVQGGRRLEAGGKGEQSGV